MLKMRYTEMNVEGGASYAVFIPALGWLILLTACINETDEKTLPEQAPNRALMLFNAYSPGQENVSQREQFDSVFVAHFEGLSNWSIIYQSEIRQMPTLAEYNTQFVEFGIEYALRPSLWIDGDELTVTIILIEAPASRSVYQETFYRTRNDVSASAVEVAELIHEILRQL